MILPTLHLFACLVLVLVCVISRVDASNRYRRMMPFVCVAGLSGLLVVHGVLIEWFVAYYSGAMYEVEEMNLGMKIWIGVSSGILLLPWLGLIPCMAHSRYLMIAIGGLAALSSLIGMMSMDW